jgi:hypothetical protein
MAFGQPIRFKLVGVAKMLGDLKSMDVAIQKQVRATLARSLESWVTDAQALTPVATGALQASGRVLKPRGKSLVKFEIIFGSVVRKGKFVDYAEEIHENHPTQSKFLEKVVDARTPQLEAELVADLNGALNRA